VSSDETDARHRPCQVHTRHVPVPLVTVVHHIRPRGMHGPGEDPDVPDNKVITCDTGHRTIHTLLGVLVTADLHCAPVPVLDRGTVEEKRLARVGYERWVAAGRPGSAHAAYALHL
jgi:hypothetical protein